MTSVKVTFNAQVRRFNTADVGNFKNVVEFISKLFDKLPQSFEIKYKDDDGELITIATDAELTEAAQFTQKIGGKVLRLLITEAKKPEPKPEEKKPLAAVPVPEPKPAAKPKDLVKVDVKLQKGQNLSLELEVGFNFQVLCAAVTAKSGLGGTLDIKYEDDENDWVTMADDKDLQEALKLSPRLLKLSVEGTQAAQSTPVQPSKPAPVGDDKKQAPKKPIGVSPVSKPWKEMSWEDIDKIASELNKLGYKNHGKNTEMIAKYEGDWAKIIAALDSGAASPSSSDIFSVE